MDLCLRYGGTFVMGDHKLSLARQFGLEYGEPIMRRHNGSWSSLRWEEELSIASRDVLLIKRTDSDLSVWSIDII